MTEIIRKPNGEIAVRAKISGFAHSDVVTVQPDGCIRWMALGPVPHNDAIEFCEALATALGLRFITE